MAQPSSEKTMSREGAVGTVAALPRRQVLIVLYCIVILLYWLSLYFYVPTLPLYAESKSDDRAVIGAMLSMYGLWQAVVRLPIGVVADWIGRRRPFIFAGLILAGIGAWTMGRATGITGLFLGRAITGLAAGAWVPLVAAFSSLFPASEAVRASTLVSMLNSLGTMGGTLGNSPLNALGGYQLAFALAAGAAVVALLVFIPAREQPRAPKRPTPGSLGRLITRRDVLLPALLTAVGHYVLFGATYGFLPLLAKQLQMPDVLQGLLTSLSIGVSLIGNLAVAAWGSRVGARRLTYISFIFFTAGLALAAVAWSVPVVIAAQICVGLGQGIGYPVLMGLSFRHVGDGERTTALGVFQAVYGVGMFTGPALSGVLARSIGIQPMFAVTAVACLAAGWAGTRRLHE